MFDHCEAGPGPRQTEVGIRPVELASASGRQTSTICGAARLPIRAQRSDGEIKNPGASMRVPSCGETVLGLASLKGGATVAGPTRTEWRIFAAMPSVI